MRQRTGLGLATGVLVFALATGAAAAEGLPAPGPEAPPADAGEPPPEAPDPLFDDEADDALGLATASDPLEPMNRAFFTFNRWVEGYFWQPINWGYRMVVPEPGRRAVRRAFLNMNSAPVFVNDVLQLRFRDAGETLGRFLLNSTVGMGGLFDAGIEAGWEYHDSDFGQTLALYGTPSGPYLVLPVLGPSTIRDGFGDVVDRLFEPLTYVFGLGLIGSGIQIVIGTGTGITAYDAYADDLDRLESASLDYYSALRSVYLQTREAQIRAIRNDSWLYNGKQTAAVP